MASQTPKTMSNRLLGMKFMQRSASKSTPSEPSTPNGPPAKRLRLSNGTSAPGTPSDYDASKSIATPEDRKREEALNRAAVLHGETKWVLSVQQSKSEQPQALRVVHAGFATIDADDEESEDNKPARMQFGGGLKKKAQHATTEESDDSENDSESESRFDSDDPTAELIRETKREAAAKERSARKARRRDASQSGADSTQTPRRSFVHEDADLGGLTSLSGGRTGGHNSRNPIECHSCHQTGHMSRNCPLGRKRSTVFGPQNVDVFDRSQMDFSQ